MACVPRNPPWPDLPANTNPYRWIVRTAPMVREARRDTAAQYRQDAHDAQNTQVTAHDWPAAIAAPRRPRPY